MKPITPWGLRLRFWVGLLRAWSLLARWLARWLRRVFGPTPPSAETHYRLYALKNNATGEKLLDRDGHVALWPKRGQAMRARRPGESVVEVLVARDQVVVKGGRSKLAGTKRLVPMAPTRKARGRK